MSNRIICDGCTREVQDHRTFYITVQQVTQPAATPSECHLCEGCERHLRTVIAPRNWPKSLGRSAQV